MAVACTYRAFHATAGSTKDRRRSFSVNRSPDMYIRREEREFFNERAHHTVEEERARALLAGFVLCGSEPPLLPCVAR